MQPAPWLAAVPTLAALAWQVVEAVGEHRLPTARAVFPARCTRSCPTTRAVACTSNPATRRCGSPTCTACAPIAPLAPAWAQVDPARYEDFLSLVPAKRRGEFDRLTFPQQLVAMLRAELTVVDPLPTFEAELSEGHWNAHGHAVVANLLVPVLARLQAK